MNLEEQTKSATRLAEIYRALNDMAPEVERLQALLREKSILEGEAIQVVKAMKQPKPSRKPKESKPVTVVSAYTRKTRSDKGKARKATPGEPAGQIDPSGEAWDPDEPIGEVVGQLKVE